MTIELAIEKYLGGEVSFSELEREFGIPRRDISKEVSRRGIRKETFRSPAAGRPRQLSDEQEAAVATAYLEGKGTPALAKDFGVSVAVINGALRRQGVENRGRSGRPRGKIVVGGYCWKPVDFDNEIEVAMMMKSGYPYILEHRAVVANNIGRPLLKEEQVHHIDGNRLNNEISNLQLRQGAHGTGVVLQCRQCQSYDVGAVRIAEPV